MPGEIRNFQSYDEKAYCENFVAGSSFDVSFKALLFSKV